MEKADDLTKKDTNKKTVIYDGKCPMCIVFAGAIDSSTQKEKFALHDMTKGALPAGLTQAAVEKEIHVIDAGGKIYTGAEAILAILETYPRLRFFATLGRLHGIRGVLSCVYRFVAQHRHTLFVPQSRTFLRRILLISISLAALGTLYFVLS